MYAELFALTFIKSRCWTGDRSLTSLHVYDPLIYANKAILWLLAAFTLLHLSRLVDFLGVNASNEESSSEQDIPLYPLP